MKILSIKDMVYTANGSINSIVEFEEIGEVPFSISYNDVEEHGREAWARARSGEFGDIAPYVEPEPLPIQVPQILTPRQARLALLAVNLLDDAELLVTNDRALQVWWEYSLDIQRDHPMVTTLAVQLDLDDEQLDNLFIEGAKL